MAPRTLTYVKIITTVWNNTVKFVTMQSNKKTIFQQQFFWNEVKFDKCLHSTKKISNINQLKTIFGLNLNSNNSKYKHFDNFSHTMSPKRQIYQLVWDADPWPTTEFQQLKIYKFSRDDSLAGKNSEKQKNKKDERKRKFWRER